VNRGAGTARFGVAPAPGAGVLFDATIVLRPDGTGTVTELGAGGRVSVLAPGSVTISGSALSADVPLALLASTGSAAEDYGYTLWSRVASAGPGVLADFAPDASSTLAASVPEPTSWALMIGGLGAIGAATRRRKARAICA
jgi:hypothetical protein